MSGAKGFLIIFHTPTNAGYAMTALEKMFFNVCCAITKDPLKVHFAFSEVSGGPPKSLPEDFCRYIKIDGRDSGTFAPAKDYIIQNKIKNVLCFDVQPRSLLCTFLRSCGVEKIVSYWGSTISSENNAFKLFLKKVDVLFSFNKPDLFIFESEAMRHLAVNGRGILARNTVVIPTGVDIERFKPDADAFSLVRSIFDMPLNSKIIFYSGHMEERKGVKVIIDAAIYLSEKYPQLDLYFLICGNRPGEQNKFLDLLFGTAAEGKVIFGGYRNDLPKIMPGCTLGVVASTGWDSFPMSTLEMAASGLPIVVSRLQGLIETLEEGKTGLTFESGNPTDLAEKILQIISDGKLQSYLSVNACERIKEGFTLKNQFDSLFESLSKVYGNP